MVIWTALKILQISRSTLDSTLLKMSLVQLADMRSPYISGVLLEKDLSTRNPIDLFDNWFMQVKNANVMSEPNAVALATSSKTGFPSCRMVLLKGYGQDGFVFFTNYGSRKGHELEENPNASLLFYWEKLHRQVRVEGVVEKTSTEVSNQYFHSRPRDSQLAAIASKQSHVIKSRECLDEEYQALQKEYQDTSKEVPKPTQWGGFCLQPSVMEFWQGHSTRLHDRIVFRKIKEGEPLPPLAAAAAPGWIMERLAP